METIALVTARDRMFLDRATGRLLSLVPREAPEEELLAPVPDTPAFALQYLDDAGRHHWLDSRGARAVTVEQGLRRWWKPTSRRG